MLWGSAVQICHLTIVTLAFRLPYKIFQLAAISVEGHGFLAGVAILGMSYTHSMKAQLIRVSMYIFNILQTNHTKCASPI
jgi:hypothetical protein